MPWVTEQEQTDLLEKVDETRDWLNEKIDEQDKLTPMDDPAFSVFEIESRIKKVNVLAKKVFSKKKPKEPKKKKEEKKEEEEEAKDEEPKKEGDEDTINLDDEQFDKKEETGGEGEQQTEL